MQQRSLGQRCQQCTGPAALSFSHIMNHTMIKQLAAPQISKPGRPGTLVNYTWLYKTSQQTCWYMCSSRCALCSGNVQSGLEGMASLQISFCSQILKLRKGISPPVMFAELADVPWERTWWSQASDFMHRLNSMAECSLHPGKLSAVQGLLEIRSSMLVWARHLHFQVTVHNTCSHH